MTTRNKFTLTRATVNLRAVNRLDTRGQVEVSFNWLYVLIAGAVILLFFIGIVVKQKSISENQLNADVVTILESILTGAGVSEKTKNFVDTSGLADYTLYFDCQDGVGEYGIEGKNARAQIPIEPVFSPRKLKTTQLIAWSLPYKLPFKVIDFLFLTSVNTQYVLIGTGNGFAQEFVNTTQGFNVVQVIDLVGYQQLDPGKNFQVRLIDLDGTAVVSQSIPPAIALMEDSAVSAVVFTGTHQLDYYQKNGKSWQKLNVNPLSIISLGGERDAAKYAAIFAQDDLVYRCNMQKAFARLKLVDEMYQSKVEDLVKYYRLPLHQVQSTSGGCISYLNTAQPSAQGLIDTHHTQDEVCMYQWESCVELIQTSAQLQQLNTNMGVTCLPLY